MGRRSAKPRLGAETWPGPKDGVWRDVEVTAQGRKEKPERCVEIWAKRWAGCVVGE